MAVEDTKHASYRALVTRALEGDGRAAPARRRLAFDDGVEDEPLKTLVRKVARQPARITDADIEAVKAAGLSEDEVFELVVCAALGQATRQYESGLAALAEASAGGESG
ncbi:MAG: hypothetical protein J2P38_10905 [Candidatus Dormibacteraeota bacterium]|nr:hypothetical protein [Candidatus Dormibacteraeota bacterium]